MMLPLAVYWILFSIGKSAHALGKTHGAVSYQGAQIWRTVLRDSGDILLVKQLMENQDVSMWRLTPEEADFLIKPEKKVPVYRQLKSRDLNYTVLVMDVQQKINLQTVNHGEWDQRSLRKGHRMNWNKYPTVEIINEYLTYLSINYPSICKLQTIGYSYENVSINMITVSNSRPQNKGMLLVSGSHAREWISITSTLVLLREIVTKFDTLSAHFREKDWYIIPLMNPDGYKFTYTKNRFWRKSRRRFKSCFGVDLNRNYKSNWHAKKESECNEVYGGPYPFSEPETVAVRDTVSKLKRRISASVDFHAYGQLILFPLSATSAPTRHLQAHNLTAAGMHNAIYKVKKNRFKYGQAYQLIYPAVGSYLDWVYSLGISHSYVIEEHDEGHYGFLLPPKYIQEVGMDMFAAIDHLARVISKETSDKNIKGHWL